MILYWIPMLIELLRKLGKSKWPPLIGLAMFLFFTLYLIIGQKWQGLGFLIFLGSFYLGAWLGGKFGQILNDRMLKQPVEIGQSLIAGFSGFGFLFLPPVIGLWANTYVNFQISVQPLGVHLFWACVGGTILFIAKSLSSKH